MEMIIDATRNSESPLTEERIKGWNAFFMGSLQRSALQSVAPPALSIHETPVPGAHAPGSSLSPLRGSDPGEIV